MTGKPDFTFRGTDKKPECQECGTEMTLQRTEKEAGEERDVYLCGSCGDRYEDRWTF